MLDLNTLSLPDLFAELTSNGSLRDLIDAMWHEDIGRAGDITTDSIIDQDAVASGRIVARRPGIVSGLETLPDINASGGELLAIEDCMNDGEACAAGAVLATLRGNLTWMLLLERMSLNLIGRLSGIATLTRQYVKAIEGTRAAICDTRKTTPGMRNLEKYAVRCGGGTLHRIGLFDAALYKDNHLAGIPLSELSERLTVAIESIRGRGQHEVRFVEVEVDSLDQMREILRINEGLVDIILLDNMPPDVLTKAVQLRNEHRPSLLLEASGGVNLETVRAIAESGVDRISVGALTHSAPSLDVGLDIQ